MFQAAQRRNTLLTWGLRLGGLLLAAFGFGLVLRPLAILADVLPPVGSLVGAGITLVSLLLGAVLSFLTVAVAWVVYRPVLGIALIALAAAAATFLVLRARKAEPATAAPASDVPPPPPPPPA
ncbi:MAG: TMEM43 family protein [Thermoanaerobaculia bacterium]